ncbi:MAG: cell filamentation protein Fic, partial [Deltaproteobacteria bacterium HGW-Deltaproteobacteria-21]
FFVPPPPHLIPEIMSSFERFLHGEPEKTPVLLKAAMAHVQFETIHPFLDGNGRVGRLLIPLLFHAEGVLREPLLYLSLYFKKHRSKYYDLLNRVRTEGDWEGWLAFFAEGVRDMAENAVRTAQSLVQVGSEDHDRIRQIGRLAGSCMQIHHALQRRPISTVAQLSKETGLSVPTVTSGLHKLEESGLVREITGRQRNRVFSYVRYLDILMEETGE